MARTARFMKAELERRLDGALDAARCAVVLVAILAVGREGLETALFIWVGAQASADDVGGTRCSAPSLGLATAVADRLGASIAARCTLNLRTFFTWTGAFLIVVAAGVFAYGVHDLQEAGTLPGLNNLAFDVSAQRSRRRAGTARPSRASSTSRRRPPGSRPSAWLAYIVPVTILFVRRVWLSAPPPARADRADTPPVSTPAT